MGWCPRHAVRGSGRATAHPPVPQPCEWCAASSVPGWFRCVRHNYPFSGNECPPGTSRPASPHHILNVFHCQTAYKGKESHAAECRKDG